MLSKNIKKKVIIIGAGTAGISSAVHLISLGFDVIVIETRNLVGGRVYSFLDKTTGEVIDNGQHILAGAYIDFLEILNILGTDKNLKWQDRLVVPFFDIYGEKAVLDTSKYPGKAGIVYGLLNLSNLSFISKVKILFFFFKLQTTNLNSQAVGLNCIDFLRKEKQTDEAIRKFWSPIIFAALNNSPEKAASVLFLEVMKQVFFSDEKSSKLIFPSSGLSDFFSSFPDWLHKNGGRLLLNTKVDKLIVEQNLVKGVEISNGEVINAEYVLSTVPPNALKNILPAEFLNYEYFRIIDEVEYSEIISIYLWFDKKIELPDFGGMLGTTFHWFFNRRMLIEPQKDLVNNYPGHITLTISGANEIKSVTSEDLLSVCMKELTQIFPEIVISKLLHHKIIRDKHATIQITPGIEKLRPSNVTPIKNFFLAGDWTSTGLPATIESAARSGRMAAEEIARHSNISSK